MENLQRAGSGASLNTLFHNSCYGVCVYIYPSTLLSLPISWEVFFFDVELYRASWGREGGGERLAFQGKDNWTWFRGIERKFDEEIGGNFSLRVDVFPPSSSSHIFGYVSRFYWVWIVKMNSIVFLRDFYIHVASIRKEIDWGLKIYDSSLIVGTKN